MNRLALLFVLCFPVIGARAEPLDDSIPPKPPEPAIPQGSDRDEVPKTPISRGEREPPGTLPELRDSTTGFSFGSYGRVGVGVDGGGHEGYSVNVVGHGSRLEESPYLELYFSYTGQLKAGPRWRVVITPAFAGDLFHYSGNFSTQFALRNAYVVTVDLGVDGLRLWAGSRMYRGDDVYLLDWWPLDNLNTVGGGAGLRRGRWDIAIHAGLNRLDDGFQFQTIPVPNRGLGPPGQALILDRPRGVASFKLTLDLGTPGAPSGGKVVAYGELHAMGDGQRAYPQGGTQKLPSDFGWVGGVEIGGRLAPTTFANLFIRYAGGLAAYGEITDPTRTDNDGRTSSARDFTMALSLNWESKWLGINAGGYVRQFTDAGSGLYDAANYVEGIGVARPHLYLGRWFTLAAELSYQGRQYGGFDPILDRRLTPEVFRASLMPMVNPLGRGTYSRPQIYLLATVSRLNDDARVALFDPADLRYGNSTVLYFGIGAEWWFQNLVSL